MRASLLALLCGFGACAAPASEEVINITFAPWIETDHYTTWDFDLEACIEFRDVRIDAELVRFELLAAIEEEIEARGKERRRGAEVDFLVHYELVLADGGDLSDVKERIRCRMFIRDVRTGRLVWRAEKKTPLIGLVQKPEVPTVVRNYVREVLQYATRLETWDRSQVSGTL